MPEPVSTIMALHGLTTKLVESVKDRKIAAEMRDIHRLVIAQQTEHFALQEKYLQLKADCFEFKNRLSVLEPLVAAAEKKRIDDAKTIDALKKEVQRLSPPIKDYTMQWGCLLFPGDSYLYCPSCFHKNGKKVETSRVNTKFRYCAVCKTNIPSG